MRRARAVAQLLGASVVVTSLGTAGAQPAADVKQEPTKTEAPVAQASVSNLVWRASSEVGAYADSDHTFVLTPTLGVNVSNPIAGWSFGGHYLVDVVSSASVDIVSTASRRYKEIRNVGTVDAAYKPGLWGIAAHGAISSEPDYQAYSAGGEITRDLLQKNVTALLGYEHGHDIAGRTGTPFSVFSRTLNRDAFKAGLTVLLDRSTIISFIGDVGIENGDPSKPYRYVPMFAPGNVPPQGASINLVTQTRLSARVLEQLPLTRDRYAVAARLAHRFRSSTLRVDERLYTDSWGMIATTTDARFLVDVSSRVELGPHARFHAQTSVDFWQRGYVMTAGSNDFPALRTGDRELGPLVGITGGGRIRVGLGSSVDPKSWVAGFDLNVTSTQFLDDIYIAHRLSTVGALTLETEL